MTINEFKDKWGEIFVVNSKRLITAPKVMQFVNDLTNTFVSVNSPLPNLPGTIAQTDLDGNNEIDINLPEELRTNIPGILMFNELNQPISTEHYVPTINSDSQLTIKFYGDIPITGNGFYSYVIYKLANSIEIPPLPLPDLGFNEDFTEFEAATYGEKPVGWSISGSLDSNHYCEQQDNCLVIHDSPINLQLTRDNYVALAGLTYRLTIKVNLGAVRVIIGTAAYIFKTSYQEQTVNFNIAAEAPVIIERYTTGWNTASPVVEYINIQAQQ